MKRNHLKKAILLGLIAASIHAPVWAEDSTTVKYDHNLWGADINESIGNTGTITHLIVDASKLTANGQGQVGIGYKGEVDVVNGDLTVLASSNGIASGFAANDSLTILANNVNITSDDNGIFKALEGGKTDSIISIGLKGDSSSDDRLINSLTIEAKGQGIDNKNSEVHVYGSKTSTISIHSIGTAGEMEDQAAVNTGREDGNYDGKTTIDGHSINLTADGGSGIMTSTANSETTITASGSITITSKDGGKTIKNETTGAETEIENAGINNMAGITKVTAENGITITSSKYGILAQNSKDNATSTTSNDSSESPASVYVTSTNGNNVIQAALETVDAAAAIDAEAPDGSEGTADPQEPRQYGTKHAIKAEGGAQVKVSALNGDNELYGVIYAKNADTAVTVDHNEIDSDGKVTGTGSGSNYIYSAAHGSTDDVGDRENVVAALYAQDKGRITITAGTDGINYIETYYPGLEAARDGTDETDGTKDSRSERTIWAQRGGQIDIKGTTIIRSSNAENFYENGYATNSRGIAITAGTGIDLEDPKHGYTGKDGQQHAFYENDILADVDTVLGYRSSVDLKYGAGSEITAISSPAMAAK